MTRQMSVFALIMLGALGIQTAALAGCRNVEPSNKIAIDATASRNLRKVGIDRDLIFEALKDVSIPETSGCWSGFTGNFDGEIVSAGILQWNYGQNSLQPIMKSYRDSVEASDLTRTMPVHGRLIFSSGCLRRPITDDCRNQILQVQRDPNSMRTLREEFNALFESDRMVQIQTDRFVRLLGSVRDDLARLFPNSTPSVRTIKWAIDTKVQQGTFPGDVDVKRVRDTWSKLDPSVRQRKLRALIAWYRALSDAPDVSGTSKVEENSQIWTKKIAENALSAEQMDLLQLTFLKSRTAQGQSGRWQALTFQRRAKIIFGVGCVAGECVGI